MNTERKVKTVVYRDSALYSYLGYSDGDVIKVLSSIESEDGYIVDIPRLSGGTTSVLATLNGSSCFQLLEFHEDKEETIPTDEFILNSRIDDTNWEIQIGSVYNLEEKAKVPAIRYYVSDDVKAFIDVFANKEVDEDLITTYVINKVKFKMMPKLKFKP